MAEGVTLMLVGMTTVFAFLGFLVVMMHVQAWVLARFPAFPHPANASDDELALVAVALAVIEAHQRGDA